MNGLDLLAQLRAYATANPTDVKFVSEAIRQHAETEAYRELGELARKWRKRAQAAQRIGHELARAAVDEMLTEALGGKPGASYVKTIPGMPAPRVHLREEPFLLTRFKRLPPPPPVPSVSPSSPRRGTRVLGRPGWDALVRAVRCARRGQTAERQRARG